MLAPLFDVDVDSVTRWIGFVKEKLKLFFTNLASVPEFSDYTSKSHTCFGSIIQQPMPKSHKTVLLLSPRSTGAFPIRNYPNIQYLRRSLLPHFAPTGSLVALLFAIHMWPCLALDSTYGDPVSLLWGLLFAILFPLSLACHLWSPC